MTDTPILIAGAGAIGSILGGVLHEAATTSPCSRG